MMQPLVGMTVAKPSIVVLLALATPAVASDEPPVVEVSTRCLDFLPPSGTPASQRAWNAMLSFAACIADSSVHRVDRAEQLPAFVEQLESALAPSTHFYVLGIKEGNDRVRLRAAYAIALGQVALMTRARISLVDPALRDDLEAVLDPYARFTYMILTSINRAAIADPTIADDPVIARIIPTSRVLAASLATRWMADERELQLTAGGQP
jgi:hypothetical protein